MSQLRRYTIWGLVDASVMPLDHTVSPKGLDYIKGLASNLHPEERWEKGLPLVARFHEEYDGDKTYSGLQVERSDEYTFQPNGDPLTRTRKTRWMCSDGEFGEDEKIEVRKYNKVTSRRAGRKRRKNVVNNLIDQSEVFNATQQFEEMFEAIAKDVAAYEKTGNKRLIKSVETYEVGTANGEWLDAVPPGYPAPLRQLIMGALSL